MREPVPTCVGGGPVRQGGKEGKVIKTESLIKASMLELVDRWFLSNHDVTLYGFKSHYLY